MSANHATVALIYLDAAELEALQPAAVLLRAYGCRCRSMRAPLWSDPRALFDWLESAADEGVRGVIVAAGVAPQLPGLVAGATALPVVAVPLGLGNLREEDITALALATPPEAAVVAVEPGGAEQAAAHLLRMLGLWDGARELDEPEPAETIDDAWDPIGEALGDRVDLEDVGAPPESGESPGLRTVESDEGPVEVRPVDFDRPLKGPLVHAGEGGGEPTGKPEARRLGRVAVDPDTPEVALLEEAVDCLLEGGIVALPTETVYGLAVDATHAAAVEALYAAKQRPPHKAISIMIDSARLLSPLARNVTREMRQLMEAFWPGPLTLVFERRPGNFDHVSDRPTIGVRLPDHSVPLALMQALNRPLACTSANLSGSPDVRDPDVIERELGERIHLILDAGVLPERPPSTVLDVTALPYRILRPGAVSYDQLAAVVGELIAPPE